MKNNINEILCTQDKLNSRTELLKSLSSNKVTDKRTLGFTSTGFEW